MKRGFLQDDAEWVDCLSEASAIASPAQIRLLFVTILLFCEPSDPGKLWEQFRESMSEDISYQIKDCQIVSEKEIQNKVLSEIEKLLKSHGKKLNDFPGIPVIDDVNINMSQTGLQEEGLRYNVQDLLEQANKNESLLNPYQLKVYKTVINAVESCGESANAFFIDGPGGSGKTFLYNTLLARIRSSGKIAIAVASSGIAAELLQGGRTAHSTFKIPIPISEISTCNISRNSSLADLIRNVALIVWDEAPMMHKHVFECVHRTLCDLTQIDKPFGGKTVLLGGDFRQVLPVIRHGTQAEILDSTIKRSYLWQNIRIFHLKTNMRLESNNEDDFENLLLRIGNGKEIVYPSIGCSKIRIPKELCIFPDENGLKNLINSIYADILQTCNFEKFTNCAILASTNDDVDKINNMVIDLIPSSAMKSYLSADTVDDESNAHLYPTEFLNSLTPSGTPPHTLTLKKNAPIMLLRNVNPACGLFNGTRLIVTNLGTRILEAKILTGTNAGTAVFLPRINIAPSDTGMPFQLKRRQFPVKPALAMTINKAQCQTLRKIGIQLSKPVFSHGQLYVAFSRVRKLSAISILPSPESLIDGEYYTDNIVYEGVVAD